jgi:ATP adenylyltransferase
MEHLWAPWRNTYVNQGAETPADLFSRLAQTTDDPASHVLYRSKAVFAVLNAYPYNAGHLMIVPYRVVADIDELSEDEWLDLMRVLKLMKGALAAAFEPHGFNIGFNIGAAAGAGVAQHLHLHVVPRWRNDSNFMTTTGGTRVHPNDLVSVYEKIRTYLASSR